MVANANPAGCDGGAAEVDHAAELITSRHKSPTSRTQADLIPRRKLEAIRALNSERGALDLIDDVLAEHPAPLESPNTAALNSIYRLAVLDEKLPRRKLPTLPTVNATPDRLFAVSGNWALASDGVQWILQARRRRQNQTGWRPVSFVRSDAITLARCMRERGVPRADAAALLECLPATFDEWAGARVEPVAQPVADGSARLSDPEATGAQDNEKNGPRHADGALA